MKWFSSLDVSQVFKMDFINRTVDNSVQDTEFIKLKDIINDETHIDFNILLQSVLNKILKFF